MLKCHDWTIEKKRIGKVCYNLKPNAEEEKLGNTFLIGIQFAQPVEHLQNIVGNMAEDFDICEIRYLMKGENACYPQCSFRPLCAKRIRKDF